MEECVIAVACKILNPIVTANSTPPTQLSVGKFGNPPVLGTGDRWSESNHLDTGNNAYEEDKVMEDTRMYFTGIPVISSDLAVKVDTWEKKWRRPGRPYAQSKVQVRSRYTPQAYYLNTEFEGNHFIIHPHIVRKMEEEFFRQDAIVDGAIKWTERSPEMKDLFTKLRKQRYGTVTTNNCGPGMRMQSSDPDINQMLAEFKNPEYKVQPIKVEPLPFFTHFGGTA